MTRNQDFVLFSKLVLEVNIFLFQLQKKSSPAELVTQKETLFFFNFESVTRK